MHTTMQCRRGPDSLQSPSAAGATPAAARHPDMILPRLTTGVSRYPEDDSLAFSAPFDTLSDRPNVNLRQCMRIRSASPQSSTSDSTRRWLQAGPAALYHPESNLADGTTPVHQSRTMASAAAEHAREASSLICMASSHTAPAHCTPTPPPPRRTRASSTRSGHILHREFRSPLRHTAHDAPLQTQRARSPGRALSPPFRSPRPGGRDEATSTRAEMARPSHPARPSPRLRPPRKVALPPTRVVDDVWVAAL